MDRADQTQPLALWRSGAARPSSRRDREAAMAAAVERLTEAFGIKGLASADFLVDGENCHLLEINPRPGATLDIFDSEARRRCFASISRLC